MIGESIARSRDARHRELIERTIEAISSLIDEGKRISFYAVAQRGEIARSTLYRCDDLKTLVVEARTRSAGDRQVVVPDVRPDADNLESALRQANIERDLLVQALNSISRGQNALPCRFAVVSLEDEVA